MYYTSRADNRCLNPTSPFKESASLGPTNHLAILRPSFKTAFRPSKSSAEMPEALQLLYDFEDAEVEVQGSFHDPSETSETLSSRVARDNPSFPRAMGVSDHVFAWYLDTALSAFCQAVQCDSDSRTMFNEKVDEAQTNTIPDSPFRGEIGLQSHLWSAYFKIVNYMTSSELPAAASFNPRSRRVYVAGLVLKPISCCSTGASCPRTMGIGSSSK